MKIWTRKITLGLTLLAFAFTLSFCGGNEEPPVEEPPTEEVPADASDNGDTKPAGDTATLISEYETFVNKFCANVDKAKSADAATQLTLAKDLVSDNTKLSEYVTKVSKVRDSLSETDKAKVADLDKKGADCGKKLAGISSSSPKAPSTDDAKKKLDDVKKNIPGL